MKNFVVLRRDHWETPGDVEQAAARSSKVGKTMADSVKWIRTYVMAESSGKLGTVCIYQAVSEEALREHANCASLPVDEILPIGHLLVVNPDPS